MILPDMKAGARKIYLAARFGRKALMCAYREQLQALGHTVVSRWLDGPDENAMDWQKADGGVGAEVAVMCAAIDACDIEACDLFVLFTDGKLTFSRGGRHVEFGYALANDKTVVVVGERENIFHYLPEVLWYPGFNGLTEALSR